MKKIIALLLLLVCHGLFSPVLAVESTIQCQDRYVTLVNPIRDREHWLNKTITPLDDQYGLINQHHFFATWLLQTDTLYDQELVQRLDQFDEKQQFGIFLEVSPKLADRARVIYPYDVAWFKPNVIFLSGYSQSDRKKLIDTMFSDFRQHFGFYPQVVGAWWIDSYSLTYLKEKYNVQAALIVADQLTTDNYGIWGQWWGVPYYPSKANILVPAQSVKDKEDVVILQWAQRDLDLAYGQSPTFSNFSLQANDYIRQGENTNYFVKVASQYLDCHLPIGQITVGLETGIESVDYIKEYKNQLDWIASQKNLQTVTFSQFADKYAEKFPQLPEVITLNSEKSQWVLKTTGRKNDQLQDRVDYRQDISFADYFVADRNDFLQRNLHQLDQLQNQKSFPWFLVVLIGTFLWAIRKKSLKLFTIQVLFITAAFGLLLKSKQQYGWNVWYGPQLMYLAMIQVLVIGAVMGGVYFIKKKTSLWIYLPLGFAFDYFFSLLRYSFISGNRIFGISTDALHFVGMSIGEKTAFINTDLPAYQAAALLRIHFDQLNTNLWWYFLISPIFHVIGGLLIGWALVRLPSRLQKVSLLLLTIGLAFYIVGVLQADPDSVTPITSATINK